MINWGFICLNCGGATSDCGCHHCGYDPGGGKGVREMTFEERWQNCMHTIVVTEKGDHWCPRCDWTDDDDKETS